MFSNGILLMSISQPMQQLSEQLDAVQAKEE